MKFNIASSLRLVTLRLRLIFGHTLENRHVNMVGMKMSTKFGISTLSSLHTLLDTSIFILRELATYCLASLTTHFYTCIVDGSCIKMCTKFQISMLSSSHTLFDTSIFIL